VLPRPSYPQLAGAERVIVEVPLGAETAVLTDRRLVVGGNAGERSFALGQIAMVQARFERVMGEIVRGGVFILIAAILFAVTGPTRTLLLNLGTQLEPTVRQEQKIEGGGLASAVRVVQQGLDTLAVVIGALPLLGFVLLVIGGVRIAFGAFGRTVVTIYAGGGEFEVAQRGRRPALEEFAREVGQRLPVPRPGPAA
jgi:hypothetical protein